MPKICGPRLAGTTPSMAEAGARPECAGSSYRDWMGRRARARRRADRPRARARRRVRRWQLAFPGQRCRGQAAQHGSASEPGLGSALLAEQGFTGTPDVFEAAWGGYLDLYGARLPIRPRPWTGWGELADRACSDQARTRCAGRRMPPSTGCSA